MTTICLPGLRLLHDIHGSERACGIVDRLSAMDFGLSIFRTDVSGWEDVFDDTMVTAIGRTRGHVRICHVVAPGVQMGDGMILARPSSSLAQTMHAGAIIAIEATGRPVTDYMTHDLLDERMVITEIVTSQVVETRLSLGNASMDVHDARTMLSRGLRP